MATKQKTKTQRDRSYIALVGSTRAYREQIVKIGAELLDERNAEDAFVLKLISEIAVGLKTLNDLGTDKLRRME